MRLIHRLSYSLRPNQNQNNYSNSSPEENCVYYTCFFKNRNAVKEKREKDYEIMLISRIIEHFLKTDFWRWERNKPESVLWKGTKRTEENDTSPKHGKNGGRCLCMPWELVCHTIVTENVLERSWKLECEDCVRLMLNHVKSISNIFIFREDRRY